MKRTEMLIDALESYIQNMRNDGFNQEEIDAYTELLYEMVDSLPKVTFGSTGLRGDPG
jgi:DNA-binding transcriptional regulator YhcF (GntR family)